VVDTQGVSGTKDTRGSYSLGHRLKARMVMEEPTLWDQYSTKGPKLHSTHLDLLC
jgi:hypothetical protein